MASPSPATQAIWDAYNDVFELEYHGDALAAAFRELAARIKNAHFYEPLLYVTG